MNPKILDKDTVIHIAALSALTLSPQEIATFQKTLSETLGYIQNLKSLDTKNISPTYQVTQKVNALREDIVTPGLTQAEALQNASQTHNGFFVAKITWN